MPSWAAINSTHPAKIQHASKHQPVSYVVFDLLAYQGRSLLGQPLRAAARSASGCAGTLAGTAGAILGGGRGSGPRVLRAGGAARSGRCHGQAFGQPLFAGKTLFLLAQDQTRAALAVCHHRLAAWGQRAWAASWWRRRGAACCVTWPTCVAGLPTWTGAALPTP